MQQRSVLTTPMSSADFQSVLADHVRDPSLPAPEGIAFERLAVYTRLVRNNLRSFLDLCFSDSSEFADADLWQELQNRFLIEARPESPFFNDIPAQFLDYARTREGAQRLPDNVLEMMDFETALLHAETTVQPVSDGKWDGSTLLSWAPAARISHYSCNFVDSHLESIEEEPSIVLTWRNLDNEVYYRSVEDADLFLLEHFSKQSDTFVNVLSNLKEMLDGQDIEAWLRKSINGWVEAGVLLPVHV
ncbi:MULTISPECIES: putative DNA-binding domain-containing protein [unclassified Neisseria]|uniref:HvfC family RiPP maturation protein n=1 Tax=unclassified Neisseria TaxID=2623750 RepID=UPI002664FC02|nr:MULTISPECIES: putative DNA-binding domain-containing protein [unclassified Neisseria]MDO1510765.1 putative DNA-binding domain-containing protein [Neisseria sp. MVDL19-042950]MDO1517054.1 putative DNA-binding domain-containing protein [Neisseria sp. MVDL18-041461]MDO1564417.1 putative DNA-binding domain-containing protein [Neisseria sp. MVDL20-010259]